MALPSQVEQAGKQADDLLAGLQPGAETPPETPTEIKPDVSGAETVETLKAEIEKLKTDSEGWKHKYSVLQGKYNAEIEPLKKDVNLLNRLKSEAKQFEKNNEELRSKVAELVTQNAEFVRQNKDLNKKLVEKNTEITPDGDAVDFTKLFSEEDRQILVDEGLADSAIDVIAKRIGELMQSKISKPAATTVDTPNDDERKAIDDFWYGLEDAVSDWVVINRSDPWKLWLAELVPYQKDKTRNDLLKEAQTNLDLQTVTQLFNEFKAGDKYVPATEPEKIKDPPDNPDKIKTDTPPENSLEAQVEPDQSQHVDINLDPNKGKGPHDLMLDPKYVFKTSEITAIYKDATLPGGLMKTNKELYEKLDKAIVQAGVDGRVERNT